MNLEFLAKSEEVEILDRKYFGSDYGIVTPYENSVEGLIRTRAFIFLLAGISIYPLFRNDIVSSIFESDWMIVDTLIYFSLFVILGFLFNQIRIIVIVISIIILLHFAYSQDINRIEDSIEFYATVLAYAIFILFGIYYHFRQSKFYNLLKNLNR